MLRLTLRNPLTALDDEMSPTCGLTCAPKEDGDDLGGSRSFHRNLAIVYHGVDFKFAGSSLGMGPCRCDVNSPKSLVFSFSEPWRSGCSFCLSLDRHTRTVASVPCRKSATRVRLQVQITQSGTSHLKAGNVEAQSWSGDGC